MGGGEGVVHRNQRWCGLTKRHLARIQTHVCHPSLVCTFAVLQGCSFLSSCEGLNRHNLDQKMPKILNLSEKLSQIREEVLKFKDFDGTFSSF